MPDPSALYPQPVNPLSAQPVLLQNPLAALSFSNQAQQLQSRNAVGSALQGAIGADGNFNPNAALTGIANNPAAAYGAPEAIGSVLQMRGQNTANATAALNLGVANNAAIANILAPYANQKSLSNEDQYNIKAKLAAAGVDPATVAAADVSQPVATLKAARLGAVQTMGPAAAAAPTIGAPSASGAPTVQPLASTLGTGPRPVGNAPGFNEAASGLGAASAGQAVSLTQAADTSPVRKGMLGNLETDLQNFTAGPGSDWTKVAKAWANRNVLPAGMQFDPQSIASQEEFTKQAEQLAQQQFAAIGGTGTDAKFASSFRANPGDALSSLGNTGIIRLLKGNEDAIQAKNKAWQSWLAAPDPATGQPHSPQSYPQFAASFNTNFDPRVYQAQYMNKPDFVAMVKTMAPTEQQAFVAKINAAKDAHYATAPGGYYNGTP